MKAIMISDKPKWCALMMNGDKTVEVRTSKALANAIQKLIDENGYANIYVYCSKSNTQYLVGSKNKVCEIITKGVDEIFSPNIDKYTGNGKVLFKFRCCKVEEIFSDENGMSYYTDTITKDYEISKLACLDDSDIEEYLNGKIGYAIHISDLEIFDKPKELSEFFRIVLVNKLEGYEKPLNKAPQNFCYIESEREIRYERI